MAEHDQTDPVTEDRENDAKRPWVTPAIVRSSASQAEKAGGAYDNNYTIPGFLS
jgi:hypothetical protein